MKTILAAVGAALFACLVLLAPATAIAAEIDLAPLVSIGVEVLGVIALALASVAAGWIARKFKIEGDGHLVGLVDDAVMKAVEFAKAQALGRMKGRKVAVKVDSKFLAAALGYAVQAVPDTLKHFGIDPTTPEGRKRLEDMIKARAGRINLGAK